LTSIRQHLKTLKLFRMEKALDEELTQASKTGRAASDTLLRLLAIETGALLERRVERRIKDSKLPERKLFIDFDFEFQTGINKSRIMELATLGFIERKQGLIMAGDSGTGKSHIVKALLLLACQKQYRCRYSTAAAMLKDLYAGLADNSLDRKLKDYTSPEVLVVDDLGPDRLEQDDARNAALFFKVIEGRYCQGTTIITTNIDFEALGHYLGDPVITTSIVDRMIHHSIIISVKGPSWRVYESQRLNARSQKQ
jgi:DNA replication protein DnaC